MQDGSVSALRELLPNAAGIPRRSDLARDRVPCQPVIITDHCLPAFRWNFARLRTLLTGQQLTTQQQFPYTRPSERDEASATVDAVSFIDQVACTPSSQRSGTTLTEVQQLISSERQPYARLDLDELPTATQESLMRDDLRAPSCLIDPTLGWPRPERLYRLCIGPRGTETRLHFDYGEGHAWLAQVVGRKLLVLFPPSDTPFLAPIPPDCAVPDGRPAAGQGSGIEPLEALSSHSHPLYKQASAHVAVLQPGETAFVPCGWWHYVLALDPSITLMRSFWSDTSTMVAAQLTEWGTGRCRGCSSTLECACVQRMQAAVRRSDETVVAQAPLASLVQSASTGRCAWRFDGALLPFGGMVRGETDHHDAETLTAHEAAKETKLAAEAGAVGEGLAVEVVRMPGKGHGLRAKRRFEAGECIVAESPLAVWRTTLAHAHGANGCALTRRSNGPAVEGKTHSDLAPVSQLEAVLVGLNEADRNAFFQLSDAHGLSLSFAADGKIERPAHSDNSSSSGHVGEARHRDAGEDEKSALGIWASNAFACDSGDCFSPSKERETSVCVSAVFRTIARINHSCCPNSYAAWDAVREVQTVHALQTIEDGDEVTIAYLGGGDGWDGTRASRRAELARKYRFDCACAACSLTGDALQLSERRRQRMRAIHRLLYGTAAAAATAADRSTSVRELWALSDAENLPAVWNRSAIIEAMMHAKSVGNAEEALAWAQKGALCSRLALGEEAQTTRKFNAVVKAWTRAMAQRPGAPLPG